MCILFFAIDSHPEYPLIICANRDEFHHRATQPAHIWPNTPNIIAGKDLQAGGTWLGVNQAGEFAGITNLRTKTQDDGVRSRGELVISALTSSITPQWLETHAHNYNPFNLVFEHQERLHCFSSRHLTTQELKPGFHAICNGDLDDVWPKMAQGQLALQTYLSHNEHINIGDLQNLMLDTTQAEDHLLPQTGVELEWERHLSSIFIKHPQYGTRSTSIILKDNQGNIDFYETRFDGKSRNLGQQHFQFKSEKS